MPPNVAERTVKSCLQSLTETGYLDVESANGRMGNSYTVVRETSPVDTFEITLAHLPINPLPDTDTPKNPIKTGENDDYLMGKEMGKEMGKNGKWAEPQEGDCEFNPADWESDVVLEGLA